MIRKTAAVAFVYPPLAVDPAVDGSREQVPRQIGRDCDGRGTSCDDDGSLGTLRAVARCGSGDRSSRGSLLLVHFGGPAEYLGVR